jgi:hypothetical protein
MVPRGLRGETATADLVVGAHTVHLEGGSIADGFACSDCHRVPTQMLEFGHLGVDSIAEVTWSNLEGRLHRGAGWWNATRRW